MDLPGTDIWHYLISSEKPVVLYGTGDGADKIIARLKGYGIWEKVAGIFASDGFVRRRTFYGFEVRSYSDLMKEMKADPVILICFGSSRPEVLENIRRIASEHETYAPDVPVYGDTLFDLEYAASHAGDLDEVRSHLADELSIKTFDLIVRCKLTGEFLPLAECETTNDEINSLFEHRSGSTFLDLGAYNGDTSLRYASYDPDFKKIIAVEPDSRNMRKLRENTEHLGTRISYVNALISGTSGTAVIDTRKGRGVHDLTVTNPDSSNSTRLINIPKTTIDSIIGKETIDFIKMDVEGAELDAVKGGIKTISEQKPQLRIACYHRSEDLWKLPLEILKIRPDYKLYLRHLPHVPAWDTEFILV